MTGEVWYAVDRIERGLVVLLDDSGDEASMAIERLPGGLVEGSVLRVPLAAEGGPDWDPQRVAEAGSGWGRRTLAWRPETAARCAS
jgi:hypothetical protein